MSFDHLMTDTRMSFDSYDDEDTKEDASLYVIDIQLFWRRGCGRGVRLRTMGVRLYADRCIN
jgi:hypothetical protein